MCNQGKALLITDVFPPQTGGSGRWFWELYRRLPRDAYVIAAGTHPEQDAFDASHDLPVVRTPLSLEDWGFFSCRGATAYMRLFLNLRKLIKQSRITHLHCGRLLPEGWLSLMAKLYLGLPYVAYVHGEELGLGLLSRQLKWMLRWVIKGASLLIANSRNTESLIASRYNLPSHKVVVLHPGVDVELFTPAPRDDLFRRRMGWSGRLVVLTVGRLERRKGHDTFISGLPELVKKIPNVLYSVIGEGVERARLEALICQHQVEPYVQLLGEVADAELVRCYQQCDLFVLPNREIQGNIEGFGMVLLEAQACGKPVVAGVSGGTAETMSIPDTGLTVCCERPGPLMDVVSCLLSDSALRERMGMAARRWVVENFAWEKLSQRAWPLLFFHHHGTGLISP